MRRVALLASALTLAFASQAGAIGWTPPVALPNAVTSGPGADPIEARNAQTAVAPNGDQVITWDDYDIGADTANCVTGEARTRVPGGDWSPTTQIGCAALIAIGATGDAVAVWVDGANHLTAATAAAGSPFGSATVVDTANDSNYDDLEAAISPSGRVTAAWIQQNTDPPSVQYALKAVTQAADGSWPVSTVLDNAPTQTRDTDHPGYGIGLGAGAHGDFVLGLSFDVPVGNPSNPDANKSGIYAYNKPAPTAATPNPAWVRRTLISPTSGFYPTLPVVASDPQDRITLIDGIYDPSLSAYKLVAWTRQADVTTWPASREAVAAADGALDTPEPALAIDSAGNAQTAFTYSTSYLNSYDTRAASRAAGSTTWVTNTPVPLGPSGCGGQGHDAPVAAFDSLGTATVSFLCNTSSLLYSRPAGSNVFSVFTGPPGAVAPQLTTDGNGYLIATWTANGQTYTSVYDAVAPSLDGVTPPSSPVAGQPATFTVAGSDVWGPVTYSIDFGDGSVPATGRAAHARSVRPVLARASGGGTTSHTYSDPGNYVAHVTVNDSAGNSASNDVPVAVAAAPAAPPVVIPPVVVPGLPDPVAGVTANVFPVKPVVKIKQPGTKKFVRLVAAAQIRVGSLIDTTKGRVRITIANGKGKLNTADFYGGVFKLTQPKLKVGQIWFADMFLNGGSFRGCPSAPRHPKIASLARKKLSPKRSVRHLWGTGTGAFRTVGRYSSATVRGTSWLTDDRCNGTLTRVTAGKIGVRDFVLKKTIIVKAHHSYFARPKTR